MRFNGGTEPHYRKIVVYTYIPMPPQNQLQITPLFTLIHTHTYLL